MPSALDELRMKIEEKEKAKKKGKADAFFEKEEAMESIDMEKVEKIVSTMKKKYSKEGVGFGESEGELEELRGIISEGKAARLRIQTPEELTEFRSPLVRKIGKLFLFMKAPLTPIMNLIKRLPQVRQLDYNLYSANMKYSVQQYLAIATTVATMAFIFGLILSGTLLMLIEIDIKLKILLPILIGLFGFLAALIIMFTVPSSNAKKRADALSSELPFALRHMATELKAGIGLYKTLQAVAMADYGILSEEFSRTISEIEEGTDTKDALRNFATRTKSKAMRGALMHIIRALKTGGNLSNVMNIIAEDVAFEMRMQMRDFAEKMNLFGVIFIFVGIVLPVFLTILGGIVNAPLGFSGSIPLTPTVLALIFLVVMPFLLGYLILYLKISQPKV